LGQVPAAIRFVQGAGGGKQSQARLVGKNWRDEKGWATAPFLRERRGGGGEHDNLEPHQVKVLSKG
jgi:hypothetical protein